MTFILHTSYIIHVQDLRQQTHLRRTYLYTYVYCVYIDNDKRNKLNEFRSNGRRIGNHSDYYPISTYHHSYCLCRTIESVSLLCLHRCLMSDVWHHQTVVTVHCISWNISMVLRDKMANRILNRAKSKCEKRRRKHFDLSSEQNFKMHFITTFCCNKFFFYWKMEFFSWRWISISRNAFVHKC